MQPKPFLVLWLPHSRMLLYHYSEGEKSDSETQPMLVCPRRPGSLLWPWKMTVCASTLLAHALAWAWPIATDALSEQILGLVWQYECSGHHTQWMVCWLTAYLGGSFTSPLFSGLPPTGLDIWSQCHDGLVHCHGHSLTITQHGGHIVIQHEGC